MKYLDIQTLRNLSLDDFLAVKPYPYFNSKGVLTESGFQDLLANMPELEMFEKKFGYERRAGQAPHDRYSLEYTPGMPVAQCWQDFIGELCSDAYRNEIERLLGARKVEFRFHWHYTPSGADVSPHCDARREHGSHLFYFNSTEDWNPAWGGATLLLDDGGRLNYNSAPSLEEFDNIIECKSIGNYSALIKRTDHAWHAVNPIDCPEDRLRRVFIIVVNPDSLFWKVRDRVIGKRIQRF
jgi:Rps23 Pro-64 3,4-dihydroxylase Tpa1-like proline 4-hydroxylase